MDSAKPAVIIDGVEYVPYEVVVKTEPEVVGTPPENWYDFLKSTRFWVMIFGAVSVYLYNKGLIGENETELIATISAVFITVRTLDRGADKLAGK